jgi:hypothetical protein
MSAPSITFEIEVTLSGSVSRYYPATWDDPADGGEIEDLDIEDVGIIQIVPAGERDKLSHPGGIWKTTSLLDGIDRNAPEIQRLFANIFALTGGDAAEAIAEDAASRADDYVQENR